MPITTRFGATTTAAEVMEGVELHGRRAVITGGSSGLGAETARVLAAAGADVTLAVRDVAAGERTAKEITAATGKPVAVAWLDLVDPTSVGAFAEAWDGPLHLLVNNAAVMAVPDRILTPQGWELQLATNHLGHWALAVGLHEALAEADGARVLSLTSRGHLRSPVDFDDLHFASRAYTPFGAYGQSKTANVLFAVEASRRWAADGITANAVFPGVVVDTNLVRHLDRAVVEAKLAASPVPAKSLQQGVATIAVAAVSSEFDGVGGRYLEDCQEAVVVVAPTEDTPGGVAAWAVDPANAERLWEVSEQLYAALGTAEPAI